MAIQISIQDKAAIERAIERCKKEHPTVRQITALKYEVSSSKDKSQRYTVTWSGKGAAMVADCSCRAGSKGQVCKHVIATANLMKQAVRQASEARKASEDARNAEIAEQILRDSTDIYTSTAACKDCGKETTDLDSTGRCSACISVELFG